ncbi:GTPase Ryh1 [Histomonas meleagridis]|uniref:GTPase Ryh1 n=1 Tax=Histomonas meleagridis TaxID=135588 RepID=UPI003559C260|nr:GTPase Ryh1 [Histomonas meleagridis]KAH0806061.1 GTPase Ryh1 [Histomonas meleagridis]
MSKVRPSNSSLNENNTKAKNDFDDVFSGEPTVFPDHILENLKKTRRRVGSVSLARIKRREHLEELESKEKQARKISGPPLQQPGQPSRIAPPMGGMDLSNNPLFKKRMANKPEPGNGIDNKEESKIKENERKMERTREEEQEQLSKISEENQFNSKFIIIGDINVGKTSLANRFVDNKFTNTVPTISDHSLSRTIIHQNNKVKISIWDTAGQESFRSVTVSYYRGVDVAIITFSFDDHKSLENVQYWYDSIVAQSHDAIICICGNKKDIPPDKRKVKSEEGIELAKRLGAEYCETSARTCEGVDEMFRKLAGMYASVAETKEDEENQSVQPVDQGGRSWWCFC